MRASKSNPTSSQVNQTPPEEPGDALPNGRDGIDPPSTDSVQDAKAQTSNGPTDPFDLDALRSGQSFEDYGAEEVLLSVDVRKPGRKEYFRVHPDPAYRLDVPLLPHEQGMDRQFYWVAPNMRAHLAEHLVWHRLFACSSKKSPIFLWAAKLPIPGNSGRKWAESGLRCAVEAMRVWGKLKADADGGGYTWWKAKIAHPDPTWTDKSMDELIKLAFGESTISAHLVVKLLEGEVL